MEEKSIQESVQEMLDNEQKNNALNKQRTKINLLNRLGVRYTVSVDKDQDLGENADLVAKIMEW